MVSTYRRKVSGQVQKERQLKWDAETSTWVPENNRLFGKVGWDERYGIVVSIDGVRLTMEELQRTMGIYEGWYFEIRFHDPTDVEAEPSASEM